MPTFTPSWTRGETLQSAVAFGAGASLTDAINLAAREKFEAALQVEVAISSGAPAGDVLIEIFGSSNDGTSLDTEPLTTRRLSFSATGTKRKSFTVVGPYRLFRYTNNTGVAGTLTTRLAVMEQEST